jgi:hypothetical protein
VRELMEPMAWLLRLLSILAAAITSLFVARDALNFDIIETLSMITLVVASQSLRLHGKYAANLEVAFCV